MHTPLTQGSGPGSPDRSDPQVTPPITADSALRPAGHDRPRPLARHRIRIAERIAPAGYRVVSETAVLDNDAAHVHERDLAYQDGIDAGIVIGLEMACAEAYESAIA